MEIDNDEAVYEMDRDAGDPPQVTVTWVDDTYTQLRMMRGATPDEWTGVLPEGTVPKLLSGLTVEGLREDEVLCLPDLRLLRMDLIQAGLGKRWWWWIWQMMRRRM